MARWASSSSRGRVIQRLAAIGFLFDRNNLDFATVHLHGLADLLSDEMMGKRRHIGDRSATRIRLVFAYDPECLASTIVAQDRDPGAERNCRSGQGLSVTGRLGVRLLEFCWTRAS